MIVYRVTQTARKRGLYGNGGRRPCRIEWWYESYKEGTHPAMKFGAGEMETAVQFIEHALEIGRISDGTKLTITGYEVPPEFCVVNPRRRTCEPHSAVEREVVFYPTKGRVVSRRVATAKEIVSSWHNVGVLF